MWPFKKKQHRPRKAVNFEQECLLMRKEMIEKIDEVCKEYQTKFENLFKGE
jgi:hypothetical protein